MARDDAWIAGIDTSVLWSVDRRSAASDMVRKGEGRELFPPEIEVPSDLLPRLGGVLGRPGGGATEDGERGV